MFKNAILKPFLLGTELRLVRKLLLALLEILQLSSDLSSASHSASVLSNPLPLAMIVNIAKNYFEEKLIHF